MRALLMTVVAAALLLAGCGRPGEVAEERAANAVPVEVVVVEPEDVSSTVTATGTLRAVDDVPVIAEASGRVTGVNVAVGDRVEADSTLVQLDSELAEYGYRQANAQWVIARADLENAADAFKRAGALYHSEDISQLEYETTQRRHDAARAAYDAALAALGTAERRLRDTGVRSPVSGWVTYVHAEVGHTVAAGTPVAHVVNDATLRVDLGLSEDQVADVRTGGRAEIRVRALPGRSFEGRIEYVGRRADDATKTYPVRVTLTNTGRRLRSGMVAEVTLTGAEYSDAVIVERDWVVQRYGEPAVFVAADSLASVRRVTLGKAIGDRVVVTAGLEPGDRLVTVGLDLLSDMARIEIKNAAATDDASYDAADGASGEASDGSGDR